MARCEGDCDDSPVSSMLADVSNMVQSCNGGIKESPNDIPTKVSMNSLNGSSKHTSDLIALEEAKEKEMNNQTTLEMQICGDPQDKGLDNVLEANQLFNNNQTSTISTQTPSSSNV